MTTNPALRDVLAAFRSMVRARGPRECLEVACLMQYCGVVPHVDVTHEHYWDIEKLTEGRLAARAALRWWRWAERGGQRLRILGIRRHLKERTK